MPGADTSSPGVSSGIGLETAMYLAKRGMRVVGTMRDLGRRAELDAPPARPESSMDLVAMDVNDSVSVSRGGSRGAGQAWRDRRAGQQRGRAGARLLRRPERGRDPARIRHQRVRDDGGDAGGDAAACAKRARDESCSSRASAGLVGSAGSERVLRLEVRHRRVRRFARARDGDLWGPRQPDRAGQHQHADLEDVGRNRGGSGGQRSPNRAYFEESERLAAWAVNTSPIRTVARGESHLSCAFSRATQAALSGRIPARGVSAGAPVSAGRVVR